MNPDNMELPSRQYIAMVDVESTSPSKLKGSNMYEARFKQRVQQENRPDQLQLTSESLEKLEDLYDISKTCDKSLLIVQTSSRLRIKKLWKEFPVFSPNSWGMLIFEIIVANLILLYFLAIPIYMAFGNMFFSVFFSYPLIKQEIMPQWSIRLVIILSFFIFLFDILLEFNTAFYLHGNLVTKKTKIAKHYIQNNFFFDVIAVVAFGIRMMEEEDKHRWMYLFFYFKTNSLLEINNILEESFLLLRKTRNLYALFKIMLTLLFCFDIYGCFFFMIGNWQSKTQNPSWLTHNGNFGEILYMHPHKQFFFSFYFSVGTLSSTMGFGDIQPLNLYECAFGLVGIMFAVFIFALFINTIFKTMDEYNSNQSRILRNRIAINRFMKNKDVPAPLRERVRQYLNEHWYEEGSRDVQLETQIIGELAPELREELMYFSYGTFLQKLPMFNNNFSRPFLRELTKCVHEICYSQGEAIFFDKNSDFFDDQSFYFINSGTIEVKPNLDSTFPYKLQKLRDGEHFGEYTFFTGKNRLATAVAYNYSQLYKITRKDFLATLKEFPEDFEQYCLIKQKISFNDDFSLIGTSCWSCGASTHYSTQCNISHYIPKTTDLKVVDLSLGSTRNQGRNRFRRIERKSWNTLTEFDKIQKKKQRHRILMKKRKNSRLSEEQNQEINSQDEDELLNRSHSKDSKESDHSEHEEIEKENKLEDIIGSPEINQTKILKIMKQSKIHQGVINFDQPYSYRRYYPKNNYHQNQLFKNVLHSGYRGELK